MKITPLEIRQKAFEKVFRGYDKDEVSAFLLTLSKEWEKLLDEVKESKIKLEAAEKEITKLREVENSLYKTLKTAEDTGANMIQQANKAAELQIKETQMKAENILRESKAKSAMIIEKTEKQAREIIANMLNEVKTLEYNFNMAMSLKENLIADLKNLSTDTLERVNKFTEKKDNLNIDKYIKDAREFADNYDLKNFKLQKEDIDRENADNEIQEIKKETPDTSEPEKTKKPKADQGNTEKSFFDLI